MRPPFCMSSSRCHHNGYPRDAIGLSPIGSKHPLTRPLPLEPGLDHPALDLSVQPDGHGLQAMLPLRCSPALDAVTFRPGRPPLREVADAWLCRSCDTAMIPVRQGGVESGKE